MAGICLPLSDPRFTPKQGQYLAFIYAYTQVLGRPPAEADLQRHFRVSPPSVHQMVLTLELTEQRRYRSPVLQGDRRRRLMSSPARLEPRPRSLKSALTAPSRETLVGSVERVTFHNEENGFAVLKVKARGRRDLVAVVGHAAFISAGEFIHAVGVWLTDRAHGLQFKADTLKTTPPTTADGIEQ